MSSPEMSDNQSRSRRSHTLTSTILIAGLAGFLLERLILFIIPQLENTPLEKFGGMIDSMLVAVLVVPVVVLITLKRHRRDVSGSTIQTKSDPGRWLRIAYLTTFAMVASLLLLLQAREEKQLTPYRDDGGWINLVGRQQAQSQKIARLMNRLITDNDLDAAEKTGREITVELQRWNEEAAELHRAYASRIGADKISSRWDYTDAESVRKVLIRAAEVVCRYTERRMPHAEIVKASRRYLKYDGPYLSAMDRAAKQLADDQRKAIHATISSMKLTTLAIIGAMVLTGLVLLEPAVRRTSKQHQLLKLHASEMEKLSCIAERANRAKSEFLANMSHEIRTPMTGILGYAQLLGDDAIGNDPEKRRDYVNIINRNGEHLLTIINDILDIAKIEAGKMSVEIIDTDAAQVAENVIALLRARASQKGIDLNMQYHSAIPERIQTDPIRLKQILTNLVGNAIKFTEKGKVSLEVSCDISNPNQCMIRMDIIDTGVGMTNEQISRIFNAFEQADTSTTRKFGGTGLGLKISKRFVEMLNGTITVSSTPDVGSTFRLEFPVGRLDTLVMVNRTITQLNIVTAQASRKTPPASNRLEGVRVLFADDAADNRNLLTFYMKKLGATIHTVENGRLAVEALCQNGDSNSPLLEVIPYDVVISDMQMPEMDGYTAVAKLRAKGCRLPIIALTAHSMSGDDQRCLDAGCDSFATKPIDFTKLTSLIRQAINGELRQAEAA